MFDGTKTLKYVAEDKYNHMFKTVISKQDISDMKATAMNKGDEQGGKISRKEKGLNYYGESKAFGYLHRDILQLPGAVAFMHEQIDSEKHTFKCHSKEDEQHPSKQLFGCKICCRNQLEVN